MRRAIKFFAFFGELAVAILFSTGSAQAGPSGVTVTGDFQSELGCLSDWRPDCAITGMMKSPIDGIWRTTLTLPAGDYSYVGTYDGSFDTTYGAHGEFFGANITLHQASEQPVNFYFDENSHWLTDNVNSTIAVLAADFQSELGCVSDWSPSCMLSWLQDVDGDGIYTYEAMLDPGTYQTVVTLNESFDVTYYPPGGGNYVFEAIGKPVKFSFNAATHMLTIDNGAIAAPVPAPPVWLMMIAGFGAIGAVLRRNWRMTRHLETKTGM